MVTYLESHRHFKLRDIATQSSILIHDVVKALAYFNWLARCEFLGYVPHGGDLEDWYSAEATLNSILNSGDFHTFARILRGDLEPEDQRVRDRAYFLSLENSTRRPEENWRLALELERCSLFLSVWSAPERQQIL